jgi:RNA 2',3'-cyclic 3'-phosphodiesterase
MAKKSYPSSAEAQLSLGLGNDIPTQRLYFAVVPEPEVCERIGELAEALRGEHGLQAVLTGEEVPLIIVQQLGDFPGVNARTLKRICMAAGKLQRPAFEVCFDQVGSLPGDGRYPFALQCGPGQDLLLDLQADLLKAMQPILGRIKPGPAPHIPMLTDSRQVAEQPVQSMRWLVREFVLLRQFLGQDREELEGIWPLG